MSGLGAERYDRFYNGYLLKIFEILIDFIPVLQKNLFQKSYSQN